MLLKEERYLVTGSMDQELRVWKLNWTEDVKDEEKLSRQLEIVKLEETDLEDSSVGIFIYAYWQPGFLHSTWHYLTDRQLTQPEP